MWKRGVDWKKDERRWLVELMEVGRERDDMREERF